MKKYHYIKKNAPTSEKASLYDVFELGSFTRVLTLSVKHITEILDHYKYHNTTSRTELISFLGSSLFQSMGGTEDTPVKEVMAFMYALLSTPNFRATQFLHTMTVGVTVDNTFRYFDEMDVVVPYQYVDDLNRVLNNPEVFRIIQARHEFTIDQESTPESLAKFSKRVETEIEQYMSNARIIDDTLNK